MENNERPISDKTEAVPAPKDVNPFVETPVKDQTIVLDTMAEETSAEPPTTLGGVDPIDAALDAFAKGENNVEIPNVDHLPVQPEVSNSPDPAPTAAGADEPISQELTSDDFAEVFASGPIQIPEAPTKKPFKPSKKLFKAASILFAGLALLGGLSSVYMRLRSDEGLLGMRMDGISFVRAYRPPSTLDLKEFASIFSESREARLADEPEKIESLIPKLELVLERDERNLQAAGLLAEHMALLIWWKGISGPWVQRFDEVVKKFAQIRELSNDSSPAQALDRAHAWRALAVGDTQRAYADLESKVTQYTVAEDETLGLLAELSYRNGDFANQQRWFAKMSDKTSLRTRFIEAIESDPMELQTLANAGYLPAKIKLFVDQKVDPSNAQERLNQANELADSLKMYPALFLMVRNYRGDIYTVLGDGEKARAEWKDVVEKRPKDADVWIKIATSFEGDARWDDALEAYRSAEKAGSLNENLILKFASLLRLRNKVVEALSLLERSSKIYPKSENIPYQKGLVQLVIYQESGAKESFEAALKINPSFEPAILALGELSLMRRELLEAEAYFKKISEGSSYYADALKDLGMLASVRNQPAIAENFFRASLKINPRLEDLYPLLVDILLREERDQEAEDLLKSGLQVLPKSPELQLSFAEILAFRREYDAALRELTNLRQSYDHLYSITYTYVDVLLNAGKLSEASDEIKFLTTKELKDPELDYLKAKLYLLDGEAGKFGGSVELASKLIEGAVKHRPDREHYKILAGRIALKLQDRVLSMEYANSLIRTYPRFAEGHVLLGDNYRDLGDSIQAAKAYQEALKYTRFKGPLYRKLAETYRASGQASLAVKYYQKVTEQNPDDATSWFEYGKLLNQDARFAAAMRAFKKAINFDPKMAEAYYYLGFIQKELGDRAAAVQNFEKYLELNPTSTESATIRDEIYFLKSRAN